VSAKKLHLLAFEFISEFINILVRALYVVACFFGNNFFYMSGFLQKFLVGGGEGLSLVGVSGVGQGTRLG